MQEELRGKAGEARALFTQALANELAAIDALVEPVEPTYSVLHRSAASMALNCRRFRQAEQIAAKALAQNPHPEIAEELRDLMAQLYSRRRAELRGVAVGGGEE